MVTLPVSSTFGGSATAAFVSLPTESDPYTYQVGFGNRFACEAVWVFLLCLCWEKLIF